MVVRDQYYKYSETSTTKGYDQGNRSVATTGCPWKYQAVVITATEILRGCDDTGLTVVAASTPPVLAGWLIAMAGHAWSRLRAADWHALVPRPKVPVRS